jgi:hypothetical protein
MIFLYVRVKGQVQIGFKHLGSLVEEIGVYDKLVKGG